MLVVDLGLTALALYLAQAVRLALPYGETLTASEIDLPAPVYLMVLVIWAINLLSFVYQPRRTRLGEEVYSLALAVFTATLVFAGALYLSFRDTSRLLFFYFGLINLFLLITGHVWARLIRYMLGLYERPAGALILGAGKVGREIAGALARDRSSDIRIVGYLDDDPAKLGLTLQGASVLGPLTDAAKVIEQFDVQEVILALPRRGQQRLMDIALELQRLPVRVWTVPEYIDLAFARTKIINLGAVSLIGLREPAIDGVRHIVKRTFDLAVTSLGLLLASPLLLVIAAAIKLDSRGPVIYKQQRVGENCRLFWMYKFRTMVVDADRRALEVAQADASGQIIHKRKDDPRVTRIGRFLRRTSLDELPQLFNVLKGDMSLVGPRPELPWLVERYETWQRKRFAVPPGITGWWQVNGRSDKPMHLNTEDDLYYIQNYSLLLDLRILLKTVGVVLRGKGAY